MSTDSELLILDKVKKALFENQPLNIVGGNSKSFYGRTAVGQSLNLSQHCGIVGYEPSDLVITVKAGTKIEEVQSLLAENSQMLGFEPPFCNHESTVGGVISAGLAGPRQPYAGAVRDFILGVKMINGAAEVLSFGGQVMKNVAGFDHSRLMVGSLGTLGVLLEVSLRVIPITQSETTVSFDHQDPDQAIEFMNQLATKPYPISAAAWCNGQTRIRFSGTKQGVCSVVNRTGGDIDDPKENFWDKLKGHCLNNFQSVDIVYRASVPAASKYFGTTKTQIIDWGGAQRWLFDPVEVDINKNQVRSSGGNLTVFRGGNRDAEVFSVLDSVSMKLHQNIKLAFDPNRIFNSGRMYQDI